MRRVVIGILWVLSLGASARSSDLPNIVMLFADDLGYGDLGCFGHPTLMTPNLDRMAREGARLTSFYVAAPSCTPSRTALLTGRYPMRSGLYRVLFPEDVTGIPESELTLAEGLKTRGYQTMAIGKWHLGHNEDKYLPTSNGFDHYYGLPYSNDMQPPWVNTKVPLRLYRNKDVIEHPVDQATLTERYTDEAVKFIRNSKDGPFFLYLAYTMPHVPLFASEKFRGKSRRGLYGDVVETIDWSAGRILETLAQEGLDRNTIVAFSSDNGPWLIKREEGGSAGLLREGKGTTYEGGMRVPFIARWPDRIPAGLVSAEVATAMDLYTTFLTLAGFRVPDDRVVDGKDIMPLLERKGTSPHDAFYYYQGPVLEAVRQGKWKLRIAVESREWPAHRDKVLGAIREGKRTLAAASVAGARVKTELFDLEVDPGERLNLADQHSDIVTRLRERMEKFARELKPGPSFELSSYGVPQNR